MQEQPLLSVPSRLAFVVCSNLSTTLSALPPRQTCLPHLSERIGSFPPLDSQLILVQSGELNM